MKYVEINKVFKNYSRDARRNNRGGENSTPQSSKFVATTFTNHEIGSFLEDTKNGILYSLAMHGNYADQNGSIRG
jgi:hypothetical protein